MPEDNPLPKPPTTPARATNWLRTRTPSIRVRVLTIALIPSSVVLVSGAVIAGNLYLDGTKARDWAITLQNNIGHAVDWDNAVQRERLVSLQYLAGDPMALEALSPARTAMNNAAEQVARVAQEAARTNPEATTDTTAQFRELSSQLNLLRQGVDHRSIAPAEVDKFFTAAASIVVAGGMEGSIRTTTDVATAAAESVAADLYYATDAHSRANGYAADVAADRNLTPLRRVEYAQLVGAYRHQLENVAGRLTEKGLQHYKTLLASDAWRRATAIEDGIARGIMPPDIAGWQAATATVTSELNGMWSDQWRHSADTARAAADQQRTRAWSSAGLSALVTLGAFGVSILLANALVRRLRRLRRDTLEQAEQLPALVKRLRAGEQLDLDTELPVRPHGADEIGEVADAFEKAQRIAVAAAVDEARTREGFNRVILDIAHRNQVVVRQQLDALDTAEAQQQDPKHLQLLFQIDHLATRARRNAENLMILGGQQPGRKWRNPVALEEIVRSAVSETEDLTRVSAVRVPDKRLHGAVVADVVHLFAELVDNATSFSPPGAPVSIRGNLVGRGLVVEIEDQGLGLSTEERERINESLRNPPEFQDMVAMGRRLGLFVVARLAARHEISVNLVESAYGGVMAIVLIPSKLIAPEDNDRSFDRAEPMPRTNGENGQHAADGPMPSGYPLPATVSDPAEADVKPSLPKRRRQAAMAPELADEPNAMETTAVDLGSRSRSPERARHAMTSFQIGTQQGRNGSTQHGHDEGDNDSE